MAARESAIALAVRLLIMQEVARVAATQVKAQHPTGAELPAFRARPTVVAAAAERAAAFLAEILVQAAPAL